MASEQERLVEAERHQRILSEVSRALLDYVGADEAEPLRRIVQMVAQSMGDWCAFSLVQPDGFLRQVAAFHPDPNQRDLAEKIWKLSRPRRWDEGSAAQNVLLTRKALAFEEISDEMLRLGTNSEEEYRLLKEVGLTSAVAAPMYDGKEPLGTLLLASAGPGGRRYSQSDLDFVFALAGRAGLAVRNARLVGQLAAERDRQEVSRKDLLAVLENDPNGIGIFDTHGKLKYASPQLEIYFGVPLREMLGRPYREIYRRKFDQVSAEARQRLQQRIDEIFADPMLRAVDDLELERPVHRFLQRTTVPIVAANGAIDGRLMVYVDVTQARELDRQRADFLTVAAHELRTPLTPLSMYLQTIERKLARGQPIDPELAAKARRQVTRLAKLVEDLLDVSRLESHRMQLAEDEFDLGAVAQQVVADFRAVTQVHELVLERPPSQAVVRGDRQRVEQVVVNLVQNAVKYSPQGGSVVVAVSIAAETREVVLSVTDSGIGIPHEDRKHLFERFFRGRNATTRNYGGLGIGLYVSHEIVSQHNGRFDVTSEPGRGSTFRVYLPMAAGAAQGKPVAAAAHVLLVDDDPEILDATSQTLRDWGYSVDEARDGARGLQLVRAGSYDLMLVDLMMPVMDGWTFVERMRAERLCPNVPLVVFSADRDARVKGSSLRADAVLRKPFDLDELQATIEHLLAPRSGTAHS